MTKFHSKRNKIFSEEQKQKQVEYVINYYLALKKYLLDHFFYFSKTLGQLNLFHGLVIKL